jgi:TolB-like protein/DNA-binding winged helix-turn-helix (wHTH) protein/tetratricopeptide (TPR) repeat protein
VAGPSYQFGAFRLNPDAGQLVDGSGPIPLAPKVFETLVLLVENRGKILTKEELLARIWPDTFVEENSLARNISVLRRALGDGENGSRFILTVPKRGYRFVADVEVIEPDGRAAKAAAKPAEAPGAVTAAKPKRSLTPFLVAIAASVVLVLAVAAFLPGAWRERLRDYFAGSKIQSLAVLPLENLSGDVAQEYFADGMTDALITDLAKIHSLRVISRTSTIQYKGTSKPVPQIARELGVDAVVEGTVLRSGNQVRVTAQLVRAQREGHLWAEMYQRDVGDVMSLQGEIAQTIADRIRTQVTPAERASLAAAPRIDPDVYELYLKGRYYWNKRNPAGLTKAKEFFEQAIGKDPNFALAYAGLADTYNVMGDSLVVNANEELSKSRDAALKALAIDGNLAEAHASLAYVLFEFDWDWPAAEREFRRSIELNPGYATAHQWYSMYLTAMGKCDDSQAEIRRAETVDPLSLIIRLDDAAEAFWCRRLDSALDQIRQLIQMAPDFPQARFYIAIGYIEKGLFDQAAAEFKKGAELAGGSVISQRVFEAWLDARSGKSQEARRILEQVRSAPDLSGTDNFLLASTYGTLGDMDTAFDYLETIYRHRVYWLIYMKVEPRFDPLRKDPRFQELLRRMKLD